MQYQDMRYGVYLDGQLVKGGFLYRKTLQRDQQYLTADDWFVIAEDLAAVVAYANGKGEALEVN